MSVIHHSLQTSTSLFSAVPATSSSAGGVQPTTEGATLCRTSGSTPGELGPSLRNLGSRVLHLHPDRGPDAGRSVSKKRAAQEPGGRPPDVSTTFYAKPPRPGHCSGCKPKDAPSLGILLTAMRRCPNPARDGLKRLARGVGLCTLAQWRLAIGAAKHKKNPDCLLRSRQHRPRHEPNGALGADLRPGHSGQTPRFFQRRVPAIERRGVPVME